MSLIKVLESSRLILLVVFLSLLTLEIAGDCDDDDEEDECDDGGLSTEALIGIIVGSIALLIAVPVLFCFCCSCFCFSDRKTSRKTIVLSASSMRKPKGSGLNKWQSDGRPSAAVIFSPENQAQNQDPMPHSSSNHPPTPGVVLAAAAPSAPSHSFNEYGNGDGFYYLGMSQPPPPYPYPLPISSHLQVYDNASVQDESETENHYDTIGSLTQKPRKSRASIVSGNSSKWSAASSVDEDIVKQRPNF